jgi:arginine deiminase
MLTGAKLEVGANSEYGKLNKVIIQPPSAEQNAVLPWPGTHPLLDEMPISPEEAKREYKALRDFITDEIGVENVHTVEDLLAETLASLDWVEQCQLIEQLSPLAKRTLVTARLGKIAANRKSIHYSSDEDRAGHESHLSTFLAKEIVQGYPEIPRFNEDGELDEMVFNPKRTLMWVRDCVAMTPAGAIICSMSHPRRDEEPAILGAIFRHHPKFGESTIAVDLPKLQEEDGTRYILEGGNIQLYNHIVAIGMGDPENKFANRTNKEAAEKVTRELFAKDTEGKIEQIMHVYLPDLPINIHLDSIFNMVAPETAVAMPYVFGYPDQPHRYYGPLMRRLKEDMLRAGEDPSALPSDTDYEKWGSAKVYTRENLASADNFESAGIDVRFIDHLVEEGLLNTQKIAWVGGGTVGIRTEVPFARDFFRAVNEQANLAANVFCTGPFRMVTYDRNANTIDSINSQWRTRAESNRLYFDPKLEDIGRVALMPSRELRGTATWGGPHCMTLPLSRQLI